MSGPSEQRGEPRAEVLAVGDELVHGHAIDTNSGHIARELEAIGVSVARFSVASDREDELRAVISEACGRAALVVATGGIGPTEDDRTRHAAAAAAGVGLGFSDEGWAQIARWFEGRGRRLLDSNKRQALMPDGATLLENRWGSAPGFRLTIGGCDFFSLPGVPREMRKMLAAHVLPAARSLAGLSPVRSHRMHVLGLSEADLGQRIGEFMASSGEVVVGITAHFGLMTVRIVGRGASDADAAARCAEIADRLRPRIGAALVDEGEGQLVERVGAVLIERGLTVAVAESCSGGLLASSLVDVPGISDVFRAGFVTYADEAKVRDLGVDPGTLARHGAVSEPVAAEMASGAAARAGARLGVAITGIAGPSGGTAEKPVGTTCFAVALDGDVSAWTLRIPPLGRAFIRHRAVFEALAAILRRVRAAGDS